MRTKGKNGDKRTNAACRIHSTYGRFAVGKAQSQFVLLLEIVCCVWGDQGQWDSSKWCGSPKGLYHKLGNGDDDELV